MGPVYPGTGLLLFAVFDLLQALLNSMFGGFKSIFFMKLVKYHGIILHFLPGSRREEFVHRNQVNKNKI